jgi:hypothetical protein
MTLKQITFTTGKLILSGLAFYAGIILGSLLAGAWGLSLPALPEGADVTTLMRFQLLGGLLFAATLAVIARFLAGSFLLRWAALALFGWLVFSFNTFLEATIFTSYEAASYYTVVMQLSAVLLSSAAVAWLFRAAQATGSATAHLARFIGQYSAAGWTWRLLAALAAFPLIYVVFGLLVQPFIIDYYRQAYAGLALPGWGEILPVAFLRSALFLLACLPLLILWQGSRQRLFLVLGGALFMLVGGIYMLQSNWLPASMRLMHSLEIAADSFAYSAALLTLLYSRAPQQEAQLPAGVGQARARLS